MARLHFKKGDLVEVITGNHKGSSGKVVGFVSGGDRVRVEGVHMVKKHRAKSSGKSQGGIQEAEGSIHVSNLRLKQP